MEEQANYSQSNEQEIIFTELNRIRVTPVRLLDIGAYHPEAFSNSRALIKKGWSAVLVEPSPTPFMALVAAYASNPNITLINAAVTTATQGELVKWYDCNGDAISTTSIEHKTKWDNNPRTNYSTFWIHTLPILSLFEKFGYDFDFINIDVEGTNWNIFQALPWPLLKNTKIICVEYETTLVEMTQFAVPFGFRPLDATNENLILTRY